MAATDLEDWKSLQRRALAGHGRRGIPNERASGDQREDARVSEAPRAQTKFVAVVNAVIFNGKIGVRHRTGGLHG